MKVEIPFSPAYPVDPRYFVNRDEILTTFSSFSEKVIDDLNHNFITRVFLLAKIRNEIKNWRVTSIRISGLISAERKISEKSLFKGFLQHLSE